MASASRRLILNAGVLVKSLQLDAAGLELSWNITHLAPILLSHELLPLLLRSAPARVVVVASVAHQRGQIHWDQLQQQTGYAACD